MDPAAMGDKDWTDVVQTNPRDALRIENNKEKKHGRRKVLVGGVKENAARSWFGLKAVYDAAC